MPSRIFLYGATGLMGGLVAQAMVASGARPVLAGRSRDRLNAVAARLTQPGIEFETAVVDIEKRAAGNTNRSGAADRVRLRLRAGEPRGGYRA
jgi:short subunit dehydrogenase-like uncharacterized protein